jgi:dTDP-4-dehydrorhamnose 3,5-epimerase
MKFTDTPLDGSYVIDPDRVEDERGFFARLWSVETFDALGLDSRLVECDVAWNVRRGTLRGMHYQLPPTDGAKVVRCTSGAVFDAIIDLRADSATPYGWFGVELSGQNRRMLYVPPGFAHGYLTLTDGAEVTYQMSAAYDTAKARGVRWNDPAVGIAWPFQPTLILPRDDQFPLLAVPGARP